MNQNSDSQKSASEFLSFGCPLSPFHPRCKMLDGERIVRRGLAFEESGLTGEAQAIACALEALRAQLAQLNGAAS